MREGETYQKTGESVREWLGIAEDVNVYDSYQCQRLSEEEKVEILGDFIWSAKAATVVDSISHYDFQGNKLKTWRLIEEEMLESGYRLVDIVYGNGEILAFYENVLLDDLDISKVQPWEAEEFVFQT